jgi:hypothetical protein
MARSATTISIERGDAQGRQQLPIAAAGRTCVLKGGQAIGSGLADDREQGDPFEARSL